MIMADKAKRPAPPAIKMSPCKSSNIHEHGYDPTTRTLAVRFKGRDGKPGDLYHYHDVTPTTHAAMLKAESIGSFLNAHVKATHKAKKIGGAK